MFKAVVFDFDGVIYNSPKFVFQARKMYFKEKYGFIPKEVEYPVKYLATETSEYVKLINKHNNLNIDFKEFHNKTRKIFLEIVEYKVNPGLIELLDDLDKNNIKYILASSNTLEIIKQDLKKLGILDRFNNFITADDVKFHKPHPDTFLKASKKLNLDPKDCVGIEDAPCGIKALDSAKSKKIALLNKEITSKKDFKKYNPDLIISSLKELNYKKLKSLFKE